MVKVHNSVDNASAGSLSPKQYNDILEGLALKNVRLSSSQVKSVTLQGKERLTVDISYTADWRQPTKDMALVVAHCRFVARAKDSEEEAVVISADYEVFLGTSRGFTDEFFTIYRDLSLPVNVWPYFREFVQNMLGRAGYPPFTLPLLMRPAITEAMSKRKRVRPK